MKDYWENRLRENFSLAGVGFEGIGHAYNFWLYKIRQHIFVKALRQYCKDYESKPVLDIGSGTGFYINIYSFLGFQSVTGVDITSVSIQNLTASFPSFHFSQMDFSSPILSSGIRFNLISVMDVLFHVTDDEHYTQMLINVHKSLSDDGICLLTETFSICDRHRVHIRDRTKQQIVSMLERAGLKIIDIKPMFILMNRPIGSSSRLLLAFSDMRIRVLKWAFHRDYKMVASLVGMLIYPLEYLLLHLLKHGPCTHIIICKKL